MSSPKEMYEALPPVTRTWITLAFCCTAATSLGSVNVSTIAFHLPSVYRQFQVWRLFTTFIYFGDFSINFIMNIFLLARFGSLVESNPFKTSRVGGSIDYAFSIVFMGSILLFIAWAIDYPWIAPSLSFSILYLWSKRNPNAPTNIWGFSLKGSMLPWGILGFNVLTGSSPILPLVGIFAGHVFYFLVEVLPISQNRQFVTTPEWFIKTLDIIRGQTSGDSTVQPRQSNSRGGYAWGGRPRRLDE